MRRSFIEEEWAEILCKNLGAVAWGCLRRVPVADSKKKEVAEDVALAGMIF